MMNFIYSYGLRLINEAESVDMKSTGLALIMVWYNL